MRDTDSAPFVPGQRPHVRPPRAPLEVLLTVLSLVGTVVVVAIAVSSYAKLPALIPSHFDAAGRVNAYQGKGFLFFLPALAVAFFAGFALLKRIPHAYNYPIRITPENATWQYRQARTLLGWVEVEAIWLFAYIEWTIVRSAQGVASASNMWVFWGFIALILLTTLIYVVRLSRGPR